MSFFSPTSIDDPAQLAGLSKSFAAAAIQYVAAAKQQDKGNVSAVSKLLAGVGSGAAVTFLSLALLQIIGG